MNPELLKRLDPIARRLGGYTAYTLDESEFVGSVPIDTDIQSSLRQGDYEHPPKFLGIGLEAAKMHPESGLVHHKSHRKIDPRNNRKQFHVHLWWFYDRVEVYSHREYRPDVKALEGETVSQAVERLRTHYRPTYGESYEQGKACDDLRELVE